MEDLNPSTCTENTNGKGAGLVTYHAVTTTSRVDTCTRDDGDGSIPSSMSIWHTKLAGTHAAMAGGPTLLAPDHDADDALELVPRVQLVDLLLEVRDVAGRVGRHG